MAESAVLRVCDAPRATGCPGAKGQYAWESHPRRALDARAVPRSRAPEAGTSAEETVTVVASVIVNADEKMMIAERAINEVLAPSR
jgi:hypothetical protein